MSTHVSLVYMYMDVDSTRYIVNAVGDATLFKVKIPFSTLSANQWLFAKLQNVEDTLVHIHL